MSKTGKNPTLLQEKYLSPGLGCQPARAGVMADTEGWKFLSGYNADFFEKRRSHRPSYSILCFILEPTRFGDRGQGRGDSFRRRPPTLSQKLCRGKKIETGGLMSVHRNVAVASVWPGLMARRTVTQRPRSYLHSDYYIPKTPMARPPKAIPMALPLSSSSVYTLASMPIPRQRKTRSVPRHWGHRKHRPRRAPSLLPILPPFP